MHIAIDRKPENGCEIQDACCGRSQVMISIEIVTTAEEEHRNVQQVHSEDGLVTLNHGTLVMLELLKPWTGNTRTTRVVCADSCFASVQSLRELRRLGFLFVGVVKTATREFPMAHLRQQVLPSRGDQCSLVHNDEEGRPEMPAHTWADRERRCFISSGGGLLPAPNTCRQRQRQADPAPNAAPEDVVLEIPQPEATNVCCNVCGQTDQHNRKRQDDLDLEKTLVTASWDTRVNLSLFGISVVDTYNVYKECSGESDEDQDMFYTLLAEELIDNTADQRTRTRQSSTGATHEEGVANVANDSPHLTPTKRKRRKSNGTQTGHSVQGACKDCGKSTTWICSLCKSQNPEKSEPWHCRNKNGTRHCFHDHTLLKH